MWVKLLERSFPHSPFKNLKKFTMSCLKVLGMLNPLQTSPRENLPRACEEAFKKGVSGGLGQSPRIRLSSNRTETLAVTV